MYILIFLLLITQVVVTIHGAASIMGSGNKNAAAPAAVVGVVAPFPGNSATFSVDTANSRISTVNGAGLRLDLGLLEIVGSGGLFKFAATHSEWTTSGNDGRWAQTISSDKTTLFHDPGSTPKTKGGGGASSGDVAVIQILSPNSQSPYYYVGVGGDLGARDIILDKDSGLQASVDLCEAKDVLTENLQGGRASCQKKNEQTQFSIQQSLDEIANVVLLAATKIVKQASTISSFANQQPAVASLTSQSLEEVVNSAIEGILKELSLDDEDGKQGGKLRSSLLSLIQIEIESLKNEVIESNRAMSVANNEVGSSVLKITSGLVSVLEKLNTLENGLAEINTKGDEVGRNSIKDNEKAISELVEALEKEKVNGVALAKGVEDLGSGSASLSAKMDDFVAVHLLTHEEHAKESSMAIKKILGALQDVETKFTHFADEAWLNTTYLDNKLNSLVSNYTDELTDLKFHIAQNDENCSSKSNSLSYSLEELTQSVSATTERFEQLFLTGSDATKELELHNENMIRQNELRDDRMNSTYLAIDSNITRVERNAQAQFEEVDLKVNSSIEIIETKITRTSVGLAELASNSSAAIARSNGIITKVKHHLLFSLSFPCSLTLLYLSCRHLSYC